MIGSIYSNWPKLHFKDTGLDFTIIERLKMLWICRARCVSSDHHGDIWHCPSTRSLCHWWVNKDGWWWLCRFLICQYLGFQIPKRPVATRQGCQCERYRSQRRLEGVRCWKLEETLSVRRLIKDCWHNDLCTCQNFVSVKDCWHKDPALITSNLCMPKIAGIRVSVRVKDLYVKDLCMCTRSLPVCVKDYTDREKDLSGRSVHDRLASVATLTWYRCIIWCREFSV